MGWGKTMGEKRELAVIAADVRKAQQNDGAAMDRILADVQDMVYYNCLRTLRDEQTAQDAAQDILIAVYTKLGTLGDPMAYLGWVKRITANQCKNRLSKVNREFMLPAGEEGEDPFAAFEDTDEQRIPDKALDNDETRRMINGIVDDLPDEQRLCVMLFYYDEMKTREIAEALNVPEGTVKSRLNYARKTIRERVAAFEQQGVKLYGLSPIPFLTYFLSEGAAGVSAPLVLGQIAAGTAAAAAAATATVSVTATAATVTAGTAAATTAATGAAAFFATAAGKVAVGLAVALVLGGVGVGISAVSERPAESMAQLQDAVTAAPTGEPSAAPALKPATRTAAPSALPRTPAPEPSESPTPSRPPRPLRSPLPRRPPPPRRNRSRRPPRSPSGPTGARRGRRQMLSRWKRRFSGVIVKHGREEAAETRKGMFIILWISQCSNCIAITM